MATEPGPAKASGRPRNKGIGRVTSQQWREYKTINKKIAIVTYLKAHGMPATRQRYYAHVNDVKWGSKRRGIYKWAKSLPLLIAAKKTHGGKMRVRSKGTGTTLLKTTEDAIAGWIVQLRNEGVPVSAIMIQQQALEFAKTMEPTVVFHASHTWLGRFLGRHAMAMRMRTRQGQERPADGLAQREEFAREVYELMRAEDIRRVYNADQTACFFEYLPRTTVDAKGSKTVWVRSAGKEKTRATVMLLGDSEGNIYDPFIVFKIPAAKNHVQQAANVEGRQGFGLRNWKSTESLESAYDCKIFANPSGWWNSRLSVDFLEYQFGARANMDEKVLLLWDAFSGHHTDEVIEKAASLNIILKCVPPKYTWACQPADISWNKPLKDRLRRAWIDALVQQLRHRDTDVPFKLVAPDRNRMVNWICTSLRAISAATIKSGFSKARLGLENYLLDYNIPLGDTNTVPLIEDITSVVAELESLGAVEPAAGDETTDIIQEFLRDRANSIEWEDGFESLSESDGDDSLLQIVAL
jgi:hypothetical protein